jgi:hypothetical protein
LASLKEISSGSDLWGSGRCSHIVLQLGKSGQDRAARKEASIDKHGCRRSSKSLHTFAASHPRELSLLEVKFGDKLIDLIHKNVAGPCYGIAKLGSSDGGELALRLVP